MRPAKISSEQIPEGSIPIKIGDSISWNFGVFKGLLTENSTMFGTSLLAGEMEGIVEDNYMDQDMTMWLLNQAVSQNCFLGEKSIWRWRQNSEDFFYFIHIIQHNNIQCSTRVQDATAIAKVFEFQQKATEEIQKAFEYACWNEEQQQQQYTLTKMDIWGFGCVCFRDYWVGEDSRPLTTTFSEGNLILLDIRRFFNLGVSVLALRQLGGLARVVEEKLTQEDLNWNNNRSTPVYRREEYGIE